MDTVMCIRGQREKINNLYEREKKNVYIENIAGRETIIRIRLSATCENCKLLNSSLCVFFCFLLVESLSEFAAAVHWFVEPPANWVRSTLYCNSIKKNWKEITDICGILLALLPLSPSLSHTHTHRTARIHHLCVRRRASRIENAQNTKLQSFVHSGLQQSTKFDHNEDKK